jgi:hypothetical protein
MEEIQTSDVDQKLAPVNMGYEILFALRYSKNEQLLIRPFL